MQITYKYKSNIFHFYILFDIILTMKKYSDLKKYLILVGFTMLSQALVYFVIKNFLSEYHIISSIIDTPIIKYFVYFYDLWYPFILINTFIIYKSDIKLFYTLIATMLTGALLSHITFLVYPSMVVRPIIEVKSFTDFILDFTYKTDTPPVNCLPSMHCVYCFVTSYYIIKCKNININKRLAIITFSFLIVLSTLFIKQHIIEDVILSFIYTIISILLVYHNKEKIIALFDKI